MKATINKDLADEFLSDFYKEDSPFSVEFYEISDEEIAFYFSPIGITIIKKLIKWCECRELRFIIYPSVENSIRFLLTIY